MVLLQDEVSDLLKKVDRIYVSVGKKVIVFDLREEKPDEVVLKAICRKGKLRAPAFRKGTTLIVGFDEDTYSLVFA